MNNFMKKYCAEIHQEMMKYDIYSFNNILTHIIYG